MSQNPSLDIPGCGLNWNVADQGIHAHGLSDLMQSIASRCTSTYTGDVEIVISTTTGLTAPKKQSAMGIVIIDERSPQAAALRFGTKQEAWLSWIPDFRIWDAAPLLNTFFKISAEPVVPISQRVMQLRGFLSREDSIPV